MQLDSTIGYADEVDALFVRYESRKSEEMLGNLLDWFPKAPSDFLDIGAGTGRDAAYYASLGHTVVAAEPVDVLRTRAAQLHTDPNIHWVDDGLPNLTHVRALKSDFDMITLHAVCMHLDAAERVIGMGQLAGLMRPGARLFMSLRHGEVPEGRRMFKVSGDETIALAAKHGLCHLHTHNTGSIQPENRARAIRWTKLIFEKPT